MIPDWLSFKTVSSNAGPGFSSSPNPSLVLGCDICGSGSSLLFLESQKLPGQDVSDWFITGKSGTVVRG